MKENEMEKALRLAGLVQQQKQQLAESLAASVHPPSQFIEGWYQPSTGTFISKSPKE